jgi:hypothetical protein
MKIIILFLTLTTLISCSDRDFLTEKTLKEYKDQPEELLKFKNKVRLYSIMFHDEAKKRGINIEYPHKKFKFEILDWKENLLGYVFLDTVHLKKDFSKSTFFHEMGHAEFNYAHDFSHKDNNLENGTEDFYPASIMVWNPNQKIANRIDLSWDYYLDHFFNKNNFKQLNTVDGFLEDLKMHRRNALFLFVDNPNTETYNTFLFVRDRSENFFFYFYKVHFDSTKEGNMLKLYEKMILTKYGKVELLKKDINYEVELLSDIRIKYENALKSYNNGFVANLDKKTLDQ